MMNSMQAPFRWQLLLALSALFIATSCHAQQLPACTTTQSFPNGGNPNALVLEYGVSDDRLVGSLMFEGVAYVSVAVSPSGTMSNSGALVGTPENTNEGVTAYELGPGVALPIALTSGTTLLDDQSFGQNETHTWMDFSIPLGDSELGSLTVGSTNYLLVAAGYSNTVLGHAVRATVMTSLDETCDDSTVESAASDVVPDEESTPAATTEESNAEDTTTTNEEEQLEETSTMSVDCSQYQTSYLIPNVGDTMTLNYVVTSDDQLHAQLVYQGIGWVSVGWSTDGLMTGGLAVVGKPDVESVDQYMMNGKSQSAIVQLRESALTNHSIVQNETHTVLTFTTPLQQSSADVPSLQATPEGAVNYFLVAAGNSNTFSYHKFRATVGLSLAPCTGVVGELMNTNDNPILLASPVEAQQVWYKAHGIMAALAWGILAPMAIGNSMCRHLIPGQGMWFQLHRGLNALVLLLTIAAFAVAAKAVQDNDGLHFQVNAHRVVGLIVLILSVLQAIGGLIRPHLPATDDQGNAKEAKSTVRVLWEFVHRLSGFALLAMAWFQCHSGLLLYAGFYKSANWTPLFWGVTGAISGLALLGFLSKFIFKKEDPQAQKTTHAHEDSAEHDL